MSIIYSKNNSKSTVHKGPDKNRIGLDVPSVHAGTAIRTRSLWTPSPGGSCWYRLHNFGHVHTRRWLWLLPNGSGPKHFVYCALDPIDRLRTGPVWTKTDERRRSRVDRPGVRFSKVTKRETHAFSETRSIWNRYRANIALVRTVLHLVFNN